MSIKKIRRHRESEIEKLLSWTASVIDTTRRPMDAARGLLCAKFKVSAAHKRNITNKSKTKWQQVVASDPSPLQDFCVVDKNSPVFVNGFACKNPMDVNADDFFKEADLDKPMMTNKVGSNVTLINVMQIAGLNILGISLARIDYAPLGQNPPHTHPRATEILTVLEGTLYVGFVTSNPNNTFLSKVLNKGDVFVFPVGLIHFQFNPNPHKPAVAIVALGNQNPGAITIANAVFGSKPPISDDVLAKAFQVDKKMIDWLQAQFWENNHY